MPKEEETAPSPNRITVERHNQVTWSGACPGCHDYRIVTAHRFSGSEDAMAKRTYAGSYLCCGGPHAHDCWHMTKNPRATRLYEHFGPMSRRATAAE